MITAIKSAINKEFDFIRRGLYKVSSTTPVFAVFFFALFALTLLGDWGWIGVAAVMSFFSVARFIGRDLFFFKLFFERLGLSPVACEVMLIAFLGALAQMKGGEVITNLLGVDPSFLPLSSFAGWFLIYGSLIFNLYLTIFMFHCIGYIANVDGEEETLIGRLRRILYTIAFVFFFYILASVTTTTVQKTNSKEGFLDLIGRLDMTSIRPSECNSRPEIKWKRLDGANYLAMSRSRESIKVIECK